MKILLAPLAKLGDLFEAQNEKMSELHSVITVDLVKASKTITDELSEQTLLLKDIKTLLEIQVKQGELQENERKKGGKFKLALPKMAGAAAQIGLAVISMAAAIVIAGAFFMLMPILNPLALLSALAVSMIFVLVAPTFIEIAKMMKKVKEKDLLYAALSMPVMAIGILLSSLPFLLMPVLNPFAMLGAVLIAATFYFIAPVFVKLAKQITKMNNKQILMTALAMPVIAVGIVLTALIFLAFNAFTPVAPPLEWTIKAGLAMLAFTYSFVLLAKSVRRLKPKQMLYAAMAIPLIAVSIVLTGFIFAFASMVGTWAAPPIEWSLKAGLALAIFSIPFVMVALAAKRLSYGAMIKAMIAAPLIAISILAVAWIFQLLPSEFKSPPLDWSMNAGLGIMIFAIPFLIVGALATAITPLGLVLGALGIILIAGAMFVVAWIFSGLPDLSAIAKNFTDAIMYPINAMIDALVRIKEEIGVENLLPLAGGLFAIAGGWLALVAALAGQAAGGLFSSVANLGSSIIDGIGSLFGGKKTKTPIELLDMLIGRTAGIIALADPIRTIGTEFVKVAANTNAVIKGMGAVLQLADNSEELTEAGTAMTAIAAAYASIATSSTVMNVDAIKASARMFEAIARVAENQGEDAISALARELMVAVKELSETVGNMEQVMEKQQSNMKDVISGALSTFKDKIFGANKKAGEEGKSVDMADVVLAIQNLEERFDTAIPVAVRGTGFGS